MINKKDLKQKFDDYLTGKISKDEIIDSIFNIEEEELPKRPSPKPISEIDVQSIINYCESILNNIEEREYDDEDNAHYSYEFLFKTVYGDKYFKYINHILR